ncbi:hypothetical protein SPI_00566 [Niveomyces insectorum RCEF 264]|uniref:Uncharacterized protein n=1 Tax=Niveomyces insectorum RCEF 264 TaxID=1081102 RepID=A0A168A7Z7_9HYPO|nr:hypothetical protein SPI_00566 [Niveomyces insectorum RCEF 264]
MAVSPDCSGENHTAKTNKDQQQSTTPRQNDNDDDDKSKNKRRAARVWPFGRGRLARRNSVYRSLFSSRSTEFRSSDEPRPSEESTAASVFPRYFSFATGGKPESDEQQHAGTDKAAAAAPATAVTAATASESDLPCLPTPRAAGKVGRRFSGIARRLRSLSSSSMSSSRKDPPAHAGAAGAEPRQIEIRMELGSPGRSQSGRERSLGTVVLTKRQAAESALRSSLRARAAPSEASHDPGVFDGTTDAAGRSATSLSVVSQPETTEAQDTLPSASVGLRQDSDSQPPPSSSSSTSPEPLRQLDSSRIVCSLEQARRKNTKHSVERTGHLGGTRKGHRFRAWCVRRGDIWRGRSRLGPVAARERSVSGSLRAVHGGNFNNNDGHMSEEERLQDACWQQRHGHGHEARPQAPAAPPKARLVGRKHLQRPAFWEKEKKRPTLKGQRSMFFHRRTWKAKG